jgi:hypothetical protein
VTLLSTLSSPPTMKLITLVQGGPYGWNGASSIREIEVGHQPIVSLNPNGGYETLRVATWPVPSGWVGNLIENPKAHLSTADWIDGSYGLVVSREVSPPVVLPDGAFACLKMTSTQNAIAYLWTDWVTLPEGVDASNLLGTYMGYDQGGSWHMYGIVFMFKDGDGNYIYSGANGFYGSTYVHHADGFQQLGYSQPNGGALDTAVTACFGIGVGSYPGSTGYATQVMVAEPESKIAIVSSSVGNPSRITTIGPHGLTTGDTVIIYGHTGSTATPVLNSSEFSATVVADDAVLVPVNCTVAGSGGWLVKPRSYHDGDSEGWHWTGTFNDSISEPL